MAQSKRHKDPTFTTYRAMMWRTHPRSADYKYYKDINVCDEWSGPDGFTNFVLDMGKRPHGKTLDRIDNSKGYYKENCRWATRLEQSNNTRRTEKTKADPVVQECNRLGIKTHTVYERARRNGISRAEALELIKSEPDPIMWNGKTIAQLCAERGADHSVIYDKLKRGMTVEDAFAKYKSRSEREAARGAPKYVHFRAGLSKPFVVRVKGKHIGYFSTVEEAAAKAKEAEKLK